jgi:hypothetical protein
MRNNLSVPFAARKAAPVTFCRRVFGLLSLVALSLCSVGVHAEQLELLWNLDPGSRTYLTTDNTQRGLAYNPVSGNVLIVNRAGGLSVNKVSSVDGSDQGTLDVTGISGGTFALNHIAVAEDGAIYAANLVTAPGNFTIYRWANESAAPTIAFAGDIGGPRYGDNIAIRGSGNNVLLAFGQGSSGTNIAFFTSTDGGVTLTPTIITVPGINVGDTRGGFAFYAGDTIISRIAGTGLLRYIGFDLGTSTASLIGSSTNSALVSAMGAWPASNFVATIQTVTGGNGVHNFQLNRFVSPADVVLLDSEPFVSPGNANANAAGAVSFDGANHRVFALEANNGVRAFRIRYPAAITAHPASRTNAIGSSVTFSVTAEGDAPLSYQWKKDGVAIAGATSSSLTIDPVAGTNAGNYANPGGSVDSAPATLTTGADIATQPQSQTVALGGPANFSVVASGTAPFGYQWRKNDADISDANSATYSIASASGSDAGNYTVVVTNDHGSITSQVATLTVNLKPQITAHPTNVVTFPGQSVSFSGAAAGDEPLSYQWRLNDNDISGANAATYNIGSAQNSDLGGYVLVVTNPYGAATSQVATLTFHPVPVITAHPQNQTTPMGNSASFSANASGVQVTFQWRSNGVPIVNATNTTLNIASANLSQNGALYDFVASNGSGSATSQPATLTVTLIRPASSRMRRTT